MTLDTTATEYGLLDIIKMHEIIVTTAIEIGTHTEHETSDITAILLGIAGQMLATTATIVMVLGRQVYTLIDIIVTQVGIISTTETIQQTITITTMQHIIVILLGTTIQVVTIDITVIEHGIQEVLVMTQTETQT